MAASPMVQARIPAAVIRKAERVLKDAGLSMSDYIRVAVTRVASGGVLPAGLFRPNAVTLAAMKELEEGGGRSSNSVEELMRDLNAESTPMPRVAARR